MAKKKVKRKATAEDILRAQRALKPLQRQAERIGVERDKLRNMLSRYTEMLEDVEFGSEEIERGVREIESGIDTLSSHV